MQLKQLGLFGLLIVAGPAFALEPVFTEVTAFAGYDRDGDLDLVITGAEGHTRLWRNDTPRENHWLGLRLVGAAPNTSAIGATVVVGTSAGTTVQEVSGGAGRGSQNDQVLVFYGAGTWSLDTALRRLLHLEPRTTGEPSSVAA